MDLQITEIPLLWFYYAHEFDSQGTRAWLELIKCIPWMQSRFCQMHTCKCPRTNRHQNIYVHLNLMHVLQNTMFPVQLNKIIIFTNTICANLLRSILVLLYSVNLTVTSKAVWCFWSFNKRPNLVIIIKHRVSSDRPSQPSSHQLIMTWPSQRRHLSQRHI